MDRGIATKDNLALLREKKYPYTVILTDSDDQIHHIRLSATPEAVHQDISKKLNIQSLAQKAVVLRGSSIVVTKSSGGAQQLQGLMAF